MADFRYPAALPTLKWFGLMLAAARPVLRGHRTSPRGHSRVRGCCALATVAPSGQQDEGRRDLCVHSSRLLVRGLKPGGTLGAHQAKSPVTQVPCHLVGGPPGPSGQGRHIIVFRFHAGARRAPRAPSRAPAFRRPPRPAAPAERGSRARRLAADAGRRAVPEERRRRRDPRRRRPRRLRPGNPVRPFFICVDHTCTSSAPAATSASRSGSRYSGLRSSRSVDSSTTSPASAAGSASDEPKRVRVRLVGFRPPAPHAPPSTGRQRAGGAPSESTRSSTAPVGVTASPETGPLGPTSMPSSRIAVAGAGTGITPCAARTHPSADADRAVVDARDAQPLEPLDGAHDVDQRVDRADLVEGDLRPQVRRAPGPRPRRAGVKARTARSRTQAESGARSTAAMRSPTWRWGPWMVRVRRDRGAWCAGSVMRGRMRGTGSAGSSCAPPGSDHIHLGGPDAAAIHRVDRARSRRARPGAPGALQPVGGGSGGHERAEQHVAADARGRVEDGKTSISHRLINMAAAQTGGKPPGSR